MLAEYLGCSHDLFRLACSHRSLNNFPGVVQRLNYLTKGRHKNLLTWLSSAGDESGLRRLPRLTHLACSATFDWETPHHVRHAEAFQHLLQLGALPNLESVDLSAGFLSNRALCAVLNGLAAVPSLRVFRFPALAASEAWSEDVAVALSNLTGLQEVGHRGEDTEIGLSCVLQTKERHPGWGRRVHTIDFVDSSAPVAVGQAMEQDTASTAGPAFPSLCVLRVEHPALFVRVFGAAIRNGTVLGLEELTLVSKERNTEIVMAHVARILHESSALAVSTLRVLRLHDFDMARVVHALENENGVRWDDVHVLAQGSGALDVDAIPRAAWTPARVSRTSSRHP